MKNKKEITDKKRADFENKFYDSILNKLTDSVIAENSLLGTACQHLYTRKIFEGKILDGLARDPWLVTFSCFLQRERDSLYNLSYMKEKLRKFEEYITDVRERISFISGDLYDIFTGIEQKDNVEFVVDDCITVIIGRDDRIIIENISYIDPLLQSKASYTLKVLWKKCIIGVYIRSKKQKDGVDIAERINIALRHTKETEPTFNLPQNETER
jgi:hypothetical protein